MNIDKFGRFKSQYSGNRSNEQDHSIKYMIELHRAQQILKRELIEYINKLFLEKLSSNEFETRLKIENDLFAEMEKRFKPIMDKMESLETVNERLSPLNIKPIKLSDDEEFSLTLPPIRQYIRMKNVVTDEKSEPYDVVNVSYLRQLLDESIAREDKLRENIGQVNTELFSHITELRKQIIEMKNARVAN